MASKMSEPMPKTISEHIDFHIEMARLMLWFAATRAGGATDALRGTVAICILKA